MNPSVNNKVAGGIQWSLTNTSYKQANSFSVSLDGRHDDIAVGTHMLIADGAGLKTLARVTRISQVQATRGPLGTVSNRLGAGSTLISAQDTNASIISKTVSNEVRRGTVIFSPSEARVPPHSSLRASGCVIGA